MICSAIMSFWNVLRFSISFFSPWTPPPPSPPTHSLLFILYHYFGYYRGYKYYTSWYPHNNRIGRQYRCNIILRRRVRGGQEWGGGGHNGKYTIAAQRISPSTPTSTNISKEYYVKHYTFWLAITKVQYETQYETY